MSRVLHFRGAKENTVADLGPYLDRPIDELFPEPPQIAEMEIRRGLFDQALSSKTLCWPSSHQVLCSKYEARHRGEYRRNLDAWAKLIQPDGKRRDTCLIYVHGWLEPGSFLEEATLFRLWAKQLPADIAHVSLPFHGKRMPQSSLFSGEFFWTADLVRSLEGVRQAVCDVRALMAWLRASGYSRVGITGLSLGGALTMICGCLDPAPDFIIPVIGHLQLQDAIEHAPILWRMKRDLERWGVDREARAVLFQRLGLGGYQPLVARERQLWIEARDDDYITADSVEKQWAAWGEPPILWLRGGHMSFPLEVPRLTKRIAQFLEGPGS